MGTILLIGITGTLGLVALGLGVFVLGQPSPGRALHIQRPGNK
jgi:hypothetical protein